MSIWIERIVSIALALVLSWLAYLMYHRKWEKPFIITLVLAFIAILSASGWFHGFFKTGVVTLLVTSMKDLGDELNRYTQTTSKIRDELTTLSERIRDQQNSLSSKQSNVVESLDQIEARRTQVQNTEQNLQNITEQIGAAQKTIKESQVQIAEHQKRLEDVSSLVKTVYEQLTTETFYPEKDKSIMIGRKSDGAFGIVVRLSHNPIPQTVNPRLQSGNILPTSMRIFGNAVLWQTTGDADFLRNERFFVSYVPDPTKQKDELLDLTVDNYGKLKVGGFVLIDYTWIDYKTNKPSNGVESTGDQLRTSPTNHP